MRWIEVSPETTLPGNTSWALAYATEDAPLAAIGARLGATVPLFGTTSFQGVFNERGFGRGAHVLCADASDGITAAPVLRRTSPVAARRKASEAVVDIRKKLGGEPDLFLLHATPGFEESVLDGVRDTYPISPPPVLGGSAADDTIGGKWRVFCGTEVEAEGFLLVGLKSKKRIHGAFVSGYLPTREHGKITKASRRIVYEIEGEPAARVYNRWTHGSIKAQLDAGGNVLAATTLHPLGRVVEPQTGGLKRYVLAHPHEVLPREQALSFFADMFVGDEVTVMMANEESLLERTSQVVQRAVGSDRPRLRGGILIYCGGCVGAIGDKTHEVARIFHRSIGNVPFIGAATFGEQGCFPGAPNVNRHGNLMCDAILFE